MHAIYKQLRDHVKLSKARKSPQSKRLGQNPIRHVTKRN
jgi:hypothetical protein